MSEFYKKHRPNKLAEVIGQNPALSVLRKAIKNKQIPHAILLSGPTGTGKTTLARIIRDHLKCAKTDYQEINSADFRGVESVRDLRSKLNLLPLAGSCRVYLIDECHKLTNDAQNAMLKILEDTPEHVYFLLGTSEPEKLLPAIHGRVTEIKLTRLSDGELEKVLQRVIEAERLSIPEDVREKIVELADGSARKALVLLEGVAGLETEKEQLEALRRTVVDKETAHQLAMLLVYRMRSRPAWADIAKLLRVLDKDEPEAIRYLVLGFARGALIGKENKAPNLQLCAQAALVIYHFKDHFFDSKKYGLAAACWEVFTASGGK